MKRPENLGCLIDCARFLFERSVFRFSVRGNIADFKVVINSYRTSEMRDYATRSWLGEPIAPGAYRVAICSTRPRAVAGAKKHEFRNHSEVGTVPLVAKSGHRLENPFRRSSLPAPRVPGFSIGRLPATRTLNKTARHHRILPFGRRFHAMWSLGGSNPFSEVGACPRLFCK